MKKKDIEKTEIAEVLSLTKRILKILYVVMIVAIILCGTIILKNLNIWQLVFNLFKVISPLFIGFIIAWLLNPIVTKMNNGGVPRICGSLIVYAIFLLFLYMFLRLLIPTLYSQINDFVASLPAILDKFKEFTNNFVDEISISGIDVTSFKEKIFMSVGDYLVEFTNSLPNSIVSILGSLFSGLGTILISLVVGLYMLFDFDAIAGHFLRIVPNKNKYEIEVLINDIGVEVRKTISGTLLVALMVFTCDTIGFTIIGLKASLLFGLFCGLTDLIPFIGPYIGGLAAVIVGFSQGSLTGLAVLIICVIVQLVENYILQPVIMSKTTNLHPVTIIIGLLVFGHYFGIAGMIVATPCIALLKVIFRFIVKKYDLFKDDEVFLNALEKE